MEVFAGSLSLSLSRSESALVGMLQTDNNKRKTADWAEEGREGVALDGVQRLLSLLYCGENASYTGFLAISRIDRRETTREEEEEEGTCRVS